MLSERRQSPVRPAKARNFILGGLFGLALGAGLAFLADYLQTPVDSYVALNVLDAETGAYNRNYFMQRLDQELARAERQGYPLSIALLNIDHMDTLKEAHSPGAGAEMLRKATVFLKQSLRQEDLVAYFGEATYGLLLPDMSEEVAKALMARIQTRIAWTPFELEHSGVKINLNSAVGIASLARGSTQCEELLEEAKSALHRAGAQRYDSSHLATEDLITQPQQPAEN
jgi:diguanylate cyclase (GGDEF)-like protein